MKRMRAMIVVLAVVGLAIFTAGLTGAAPLGPYEVGGYVVYFDGVRHFPDPPPGTSTWYYTVESPAACQAISHVTFEWIGCCELVEAGEWGPTFDDLDPWDFGGGPGEIEVGVDGSTGYTGFKFNDTFADGQTRYYYFTLAKSMSVIDDGLSMIVKTGEDGCPSTTLAQMAVAEVPELGALGATGTVVTTTLPGPNYNECGYTTVISLKSFSAESPETSVTPPIWVLGALVAALVLPATLVLGSRLPLRRP